MLRSIEILFRRILDEDKPQKLASHDIEIASAALLVNCSRVDGNQSLEESKYLRSVLGKYFNLSNEEIESVVECAEALERDAIDLHRFTRVLHYNMDRDSRIQMIQMLWEMANSDGHIDHDERQMISLTAQLLEVELHDVVSTRQAAQAKRNRT
ncbi:MAG: hypothetical protein TECD_00928 [Hyphomicrobiaceae bacterium hypho_1]